MRLLSALGVTICLCLASVSAAKSVGRFYGYGTGINGLPLFYSDGVAYLGYARPKLATTATNVTFTTDSSVLTAAPTNSSVKSHWPKPRFFIDRSSGAFDAAGFTSTSNTSVTTNGFDLFGTSLVWKGSAGELEAKWYAVPVANQGALYTLNWNVDNIVAESAVPVVVKNIKPSST